MENNKKYPNQYFIKRWMGWGLVMGPAFGVIFMSLTDKKELLGFGIPFGMLIGLMIGASIEKKYREEGKVEPPSEEEKKKQKRGMYIGISVLIIAMIAFLVLLKL